jgi:uncharacterized DUF497 family protein
VATVEYGDFEWDATKAAQNERKHCVSQVARMLFIVFAERGERIRIISACRANAAQRKKYEEGS